MNNKILPVEQEDRDAAAEYWDCQGYPTFYRTTKDGEADNESLVQSFAKHRIQVAEAVREACAKVADEHAKTWGLAHSTPALAIASAIRNLDLSTLLSKRGM